MEYQKLINLLDNTPNKPNKLRTKNCLEINDESRERIVIIVKFKLKLLIK